MIEESAAPRGATVRSPDRIRDLMTGEMREVDASIRFRLGTVDILITIECRKRSRKADDTWIEQLATKKQKLGAARTIAVSEKGFTKAAYLTATHHGIDLRILSEIRPEDIEDWFLPGSVEHAIPEAANLRCSVRVEGCVEYIELSDPTEPIFFHNQIASPFPAEVLWAFHEMAQPRRFSELPRDGSVTRVEFDIDATKPDFIPVPTGLATASLSRLLIELDGSRKVVTDIKISAEVSINVSSFDSADGVHHVYEGADGIVAQHTSFKGEAFGLPVTFDLTSRGGDVSGIAEFPSGARLGLGWMGSTSPLDLKRATCAFCDRSSEMEPQPVLPEFLVPRGVRAEEHFLCTKCGKKFGRLDTYAAQVWRNLPKDLTGTLHGAFSVEPVSGVTVRLWLLSLLWRMGASRALSEIELGEHADVLRRLLHDEDPGPPHHYPVICVALECEGKRLEFFWPPQLDLRRGNRVLSIVLQGVLFEFLLGTDTSGGRPFVSDDTWVFPIIDWRKVPFLVDAALKARTTAGDRVSSKF